MCDAPLSLLATLTADPLPEYIKKSTSLTGINSKNALSLLLHAIAGGEGTHLSYRNESNLKLTLFPKLRQVFQSVRSNCAINVEVKSPYPIEVSAFVRQVK